MKNKLKAFSLIELSIVILIIGILVVGVTQSSRLVRRMRLMSAIQITRSSDVNTIKDIFFGLRRQMISLLLSVRTVALTSMVHTLMLNALPIKIELVDGTIFIFSTAQLKKMPFKMQPPGNQNT